jgi:ABC-2 type transport system ATP-binding protein
MPAPVLEVIGVRKRFGKTIALDGVSLAVNDGEMFGLLGPNGAGKTTLISILCGLTAADAGEVRLFGKPFHRGDRDLRRLVGIGTQDLSIYPDLSARENLRFFGKLYGIRGAELETRVGEMLASVGLSERADDRAGAFSGGMKRRLNLAAAIVHRPRLLVLDEPTTGVDPQSRNHIFERVKALNAVGVTVIYTSHYMEEVQKLCTRIAILESGKLLACDTLPKLLKLLDGTIRIAVANAPNDFAERLAAIPGVKRVEQSEGFQLTVENAAAVLARIAGLCAADGIELTAASIREPTLERVFLQLTGRELRD